MYIQAQVNHWLALLILGLTVLVTPNDVQAKETAAAQWTPCKLNDPNNGSCLKDLMQKILITGTTKNLIDPYKLKKARVTVDTPVVRLNMEFMKVVINGMSQSKISDVSGAKGDKYILNLKLPKMHITGNYSMNGQVLVLNLSGKGVFDVDFADVDIGLILIAKVVERDGEHFFVIEKLKSSIKHIGNLHVKFANLFADNQALTDSANELFNQNWRELIDVMRPVIEETMDASTVAQANKILKNLPAREILSDIP